MIQCNRYHLQYIGETKRRRKDRFDQHRRSVDKTTYILSFRAGIILIIAILTCD